MKRLFLILLSLILFSCQRTVEDKIVNNIEKNCKQFPCIVRIKEITDFDWDKMYVFGYGASIDQIEQAVGTYIPEKTRFTRKIAFTKDSLVVHYDELPTDIEGMVNNQVNFDGIDGPVFYKVYSTENAVFEVGRYSVNSVDIFYDLKQIP